MRRSISIFWSFCLLPFLGGSGDISTQSQELIKDISGHWELRAFIEDGNRHSMNGNALLELKKNGEASYTQSGGERLFEWQYFEEKEVIITKSKPTGIYSRLKVLLATNDSLRYEQVTRNGLEEYLFIKLK